MKYTKRILALILALLTIVLTACSGGSGAGSTTAAPTEAPVDEVTLDKSYVIVVDKKAHVATAQAAECIQATLEYKMGLRKIKIENTDPGSNAIVFRVDETMEAGTHKVELKGTSIYLTAQDPHILLLVTRQLRQLMIDNGAAPVVTKEMCAQLCGTKDMATLPFRFLSQNILFKDIEGGNTVADRRPRFKALMQEYCPDILAVQEHSGGWETNILNDFGNIYVRHATQGLAIYFRKDRYEIVDKGGFYMSPTPNVKSQFEGDSGPRSCIWAIAKDKFTDVTTLYINCHPDWNNDTQRALQVDVLFEVMGEKMAEYPTILCGDFNTTPDGPVYPRIVKEVKDTYKEAEINLSEIDYTCHSFGSASSFIDYTFYNHTFKPTLYRIINDMYNGHVSDHYGIFTDFEYVK